MIILKSERDIEGMRAAGAVASAVLEDLCTWITPGITTEEIDCHASSCIKSRGAKSAFLGYRKYPCHVCLSVNEEVVHGLAGDRPVHLGILSDRRRGVLSGLHQGYCEDNRGRRV